MSIPATKTAREIESSTIPRPQLRVLLVHNDPADRDLILRELGKGEFEIISDRAATADEFRQRIRATPPDVVLADYDMGQWRGSETVEILRAEGLDIPVILVSGGLGDEAAVECIRQGACDHILRDSLGRLPAVVRRAWQERAWRTERTVLQRALAERVEELEQFANLAAHDLQEPLRMVASYTQLLAERYRGRLDDQADTYIHYALDGAARMQSLIQDLLAFSRMARQEAAIKTTDCNQIVERATANLRVAITESEAAVTHGSLPTLLANGSQLQQVFQNLMGNSLKFKSSQTPVIHISAERQGPEWIFSVADNGIGISMEQAENVFIILKRLHSRAEYPGNGIGLAICKKIIEWHGGKIKAIPRESGGTIFQFTLPAASS